MHSVCNCKVSHFNSLLPEWLPQDSKQRLKAMQKSSQPIPATAYSHDGTIFAYSVSYDWSRGHAEHNPATAKNYILLHSPSENEVRYSPCGMRHSDALRACSLRASEVLKGSIAGRGLTLLLHLSSCAVCCVQLGMHTRLSGCDGQSSRYATAANLDWQVCGVSGWYMLL